MSELFIGIDKILYDDNGKAYGVQAGNEVMNNHAKIVFYLSDSCL